MEVFKQWYDRRHEYAKEWKKRTGGKVIGTFCTYVPEEILTGEEAMYMAITSQFVDKEEHSNAVQATLKSFSARKLPRETGIRLMVGGARTTMRNSSK